MARPAPELLLLQVSRHRDGRKSFVPVWPDAEVRIPFCGDGLQVVWLRYKVLAAAEHHGTDDGVAAVVTPLDRGRAELSYLFWAARAQEGEASVADSPHISAAPPLYKSLSSYVPGGDAGCEHARWRAGVELLRQVLAQWAGHAGASFLRMLHGGAVRGG